MNKPEFLALLSLKSDIHKVNCEVVLDKLGEIIYEEVHQKGDQISISGLGIFKQKKSDARTGRNPKTGEPTEIKAKTKVIFSAAPYLKK